MSTKLVVKDSLRNLSSEAGPGAEGVDAITGDMMKYLTWRPDLCLLSPGLCILFRRLLDHLTGLLVQGICLPDHARALVLRYSRLLIFAVRM